MTNFDSRFDLDDPDMDIRFEDDGYDDDYDDDYDYDDDDYDDGQPSEYDEWRDFMGGDDWDHGQYGDMDY